MSNPIQNNLALNVRTKLINGQIDLDNETMEYIRLVRSEISQCAKNIHNAAPATVDIGRMMAGMDTLHEATHIFCVAGMIGREYEKQNLC